MRETRVWSLGREDSPGEGNGNPLQDSGLENPMDAGAWWSTVHGVTKSWTRLSDFTSLSQKLEVASGSLCNIRGKQRRTTLYTLQSWEAHYICLHAESEWKGKWGRSVMSDSLQPHGLQPTRLPVLHYLPETAQTHVRWVGDAIQPSHPLYPLQIHIF